jgi:hypothetical protein
MYTRKKIVNLAPKNIIFRVLGAERGSSQFFKTDSVFQSSNTDLAKFHVSSINIRRDKFFDLMTFRPLPKGLVGTPTL